MNFKEGLNNRGQEGLTLTTVLLIILGVVAVVVIILFVNGFFNKIQGATNQLPSDLQAAVSACEISGSSNLVADYCSNFRKVTINGQTQYQTCTNPAIITLMDPSKLLQNGCGTNAPNAPTFCKAQSLTKNTLVGTQYCNGTYVGGTVSDWARTAPYT